MVEGNGSRKPPDLYFLTGAKYNDGMRRWYALPIRTRLGIISVTLLAVAVISAALYFVDPLHTKPAYGIIKWAPILFLFWIAWPDLERIPRWMYYVSVPIIILCALRPVLLYIVIPVGLVALFIMPKK